MAAAQQAAGGALRIIPILAAPVQADPIEPDAGSVGV